MPPSPPSPDNIRIADNLRRTIELTELGLALRQAVIEQRNERIAALADGKNIFYLDMNEVVCDEEGNLKSSLTFDDIHLYGSKYGIWVDYLKENGI